ncbi:preprotein translocase subunit SecE [Muribaculum sp. An289]|uniref:Protein translocase subunit SecE n=1 Tax=Candidatus Merdivivens faecigallinarum TaxID=2840871 RepID=A0A9D9J0M7_9BACT|nr:MULTISPECIES: preprotein translocase subunit SecE [unclassified Muribaculum]MBO8481003.1 preprotein translocase subunit SecE [Candidatus Merdivivens faecigallinarum]OUO37706.1 preprotein translocase subunit SecE [Muribaculum sp. An289]OUO43754.1 preprotein translocase subunit SecE [Muribaculum sp. An287]
MSKFTNYFKESYKELTQKVTWPTWQKLQSSAIVVMVASVIFAVVIFLMDYAFQNILTAIYSL